MKRVKSSAEMSKSVTKRNVRNSNIDWTRKKQLPAIKDELIGKPVKKGSDIIIKFDD